MAESTWQHITVNAGELTRAVNLEHIPPDINHTLVLSVGVRYGTLGRDQKIQQAAGSGSAKILAAV